MADTTSRRRGNRLGLWFFRVFLSLFGLSGAYGLLYFVCLYYMVFDKAAFSSIMAYIKRRFKGQGLFGRLLGVYRILINQGKNLIDRYYIISGQGKFDTELLGYDKISNFLKNSNKGLIILTAHVGNWQVTMTALEEMGRTVHLLMRPEDNLAVRDTLNVGGETGKVRVISTDGFLGGSVECVNAINRGEIVSIMGDRSYGANSVEVEFLGGHVKFPYGAFSIAASTGCPVVALLSAKVSAKKYVAEVAKVIIPQYSLKSTRQQNIRGWVQEFADALERYVEDHPYQWFVFYNIWEREEC